MGVITGWFSDGAIVRSPDGLPVAFMTPKAFQRTRIDERYGQRFRAAFGDGFQIVVGGFRPEGEERAAS